MNDKDELIMTRGFTPTPPGDEFTDVWNPDTNLPYTYAELELALENLTNREQKTDKSVQV